MGAALSGAMRTLAFLSLLASLSTAFASAASANGPAVIAHDEDTEVHGLPAISGDGRTLAILRRDADPSDAERIAVAFVDARTGATMGEWLVLERDDERRLLPLPADERGATPWRRARNLTLHLAARDFRPLTALREGDAVGELVDEISGLRLVHHEPGDDLVVVDGSGRERLRRRLPIMTSYCGMSDDAPTEAHPSVTGALFDARTRTLLLSYGHTYASCMCDDDIVTEVLRLAR